MYKAASSSCLPPHSNSSVGLHSVALSQPTITTPLVLLLAVGGVVFSSMQTCHTYSAVWVIHVSMALQYSLAVVDGTGGEVSVHRQRVGGFHPGCTCGVKGKLCNGLRRCTAARSEWAHLNPWFQMFGWDCSQFPPNTWRKLYNLFFRFCSVCVSRYDNKTNEAVYSWL